MIIRLPVDTKPDRWASIDWAHPLTRGLQEFWLALAPGVEVDLVSGRIVGVTGASVVTTLAGEAINEPGITTDLWQSSRTVSLPMTLAGQYVYPSYAGAAEYVLLHRVRVGTTSKEYHLRARLNSSTSRQHFSSSVRNDGASSVGVDVVDSAAYIADGRLASVAALSRSPTQHEIWVDGQLISSATGDALSDTWTGMDRTDFGSDRNGAALWRGWWLRDLDAEEIESLHRNPWQVIERRKIWVPATSVSGVTVQPAQGVIRWRGGQPSVRTVITARPASGSALWRGGQPTIKTAITARPAAGLILWTGGQPAVSTAQQAAAQPMAGRITWVGGQPSVKTQISVRPAQGAISWTGGLPSVVIEKITVYPKSGLTVMSGGQPTIVARNAGWTKLGEASTPWTVVPSQSTSWTKQ